MLDAKHLQRTQSNNTSITSRLLHPRLISDVQPGSNLWPCLDVQPGSDLPSKLYVLVHFFAACQNAELPPQTIRYKLIHLFATYALKLQVLQIWRAISKSYMLLSWLVHSCTTYTHIQLVRVCFLRFIKDAELQLQCRLRAKSI